MATVEIKLALSEELAKDARELDLLSSESVTALLRAEIERRKMDSEDEAAWEEAILAQALGDALHPDGSIDMDKLVQASTMSTVS